MKRYLIERELPGVGSMASQQLKEAAAKSNEALATLKGRVQWLESFVTDDRTYCIYIAESEDAVNEHARISGFPASRITEIRSVINPMTGTS